MRSITCTLQAAGECVQMVCTLAEGQSAAPELASASFKLLKQQAFLYGAIPAGNWLSVVLGTNGAAQLKLLQVCRQHPHRRQQHDRYSADEAPHCSTIGRLTRRRGVAAAAMHQCMFQAQRI
jgi:hypothetical protein